MGYINSVMHTLRGHSNIGKTMSHGYNTETHWLVIQEGSETEHITSYNGQRPGSHN